MSFSEITEWLKSTDCTVYQPDQRTYSIQLNQNSAEFLAILIKIVNNFGLTSASFKLGESFLDVTEHTIYIQNLDLTLFPCRDLFSALFQKSLVRFQLTYEIPETIFLLKLLKDSAVRKLTLCIPTDLIIAECLADCLISKDFKSIYLLGNLSQPIISTLLYCFNRLNYVYCPTVECPTLNLGGYTGNLNDQFEDHSHFIEDYGLIKIPLLKNKKLLEDRLVDSPQSYKCRLTHWQPCYFWEYPESTRLTIQTILLLANSDSLWKQLPREMIFQILDWLI